MSTEPYRHETLPGGRRVGRFPALVESGIPHLVTTAEGFDVYAAREDRATGAREATDALDGGPVAFCEQVHGGRVLVARRPGLVGAADGLVTDRPELALACFSADCPLILLVEAGSGVVGLVHASWRATVRGVARAGLASIAALGADPGAVVACICPSAGPERYEVGPEVRAEALARLGSDAAAHFRPRGTKWLFDLWSANAAALRAGGVAPGHIHVAGVCTLADPRYPSHRRANQDAGRFVAVVKRGESGAPRYAQAKTTDA